MRHVLLAAAMLACAPAAWAGDVAGGFDLFASDDGDDTSVLRTGLTAYHHYEDPTHYRGLTVEHARIRPQGTHGWSENRIYYRFADSSAEWTWNAQVGTNGDTLLGNASLLREARLRQEYFVEREVVETRQGENGLYATFVGAAVDLPLDASERQQLTLLAGVQDFTGENLRGHLRAVYSALLVPQWGLSAQLRARAFHNSQPGEADYYSPRWFAEAIPMLRVRRFHHRWMLSVAAGIGAQRDNDSDPRAARLAQVVVESPRAAGRWYLRATGTYSNTPVGEGINYGYRQVGLQLIQPF